MTTKIKNNQNNQITQQPQNPKLPIPNDKRQPQQPQPLDPKWAMQRPLKAELGQPKEPKQPEKEVAFGERFFCWYSRFCNRLGRALLTAIIIRILFEIAPAMKEEFPKVYAVYNWLAEQAENVFKFVFGFLGSLFRGELGEFHLKVWDGIKAAFTNFINLF